MVDGFVILSSWLSTFNEGGLAFGFTGDVAALAEAHSWSHPASKDTLKNCIICQWNQPPELEKRQLRLYWRLYGKAFA